MKKLKKLFKIFLLAITIPIYILRMIICYIFFRLAKFCADRNCKIVGMPCYHIANFVHKDFTEMMLNNKKTNNK